MEIYKIRHLEEMLMYADIETRYIVDSILEINRCLVVCFLYKTC